MMRHLYFTLSLLAVCIFISSCGSEPTRKTENFNFNWSFSKGSHTDAIRADFDDSSWEKIDLPHDWAISGPVEVEGDANTGKLPWKGEGWYRKTFSIDKAAKGKHIYFVFDGIMAFPKVYINGDLAVKWDYGYNSFYVDATKFIKLGQQNLMTIQASTENHRSRWYPGAGIYRKIQMITVDPVHVAQWGTYITTPEITNAKASVKIRTTVTNKDTKDQKVQIETQIIDPQGNIVASSTEEQTIEKGEEFEFAQDMNVANPQRWDLTNPARYTARTIVSKNGKVCDNYDTRFGIRTIKWTSNDGFHLNGKRVQINGVNLHHDHGPLGAAFYRRAMERQIEIMKDMGCNAIRTSHNVPSPELVELCDSMGVLVFDETFDKWSKRWGATSDLCPEDDLLEFTESQIKNFVMRDRNHPSIVIWSVGNEIPDIELNREEDAFKKLESVVNFMRKYDPTRPVTFVTFMPESMPLKHYTLYDVHSWNYGGKYLTIHEQEPGMATVCTESGSALSTRGYYEVPPVQEKNYSNNDTRQICSYDLQAVNWGDIPDWEFYRLQINPYAAGEFVWTGIDYLGEPTPYNSGLVRREILTAAEASRSSYFGIVDLCGIPKDRFYLYRSHWAPEKTTIHILPHWNWEGREGKNVPVTVYTNGESAELFLNGKSLGKRTKEWIDDLEIPIHDAIDDPNYYKILNTYRLVWEDVIYEPGELKVVAYKDGKQIGTKAMKTAGTPSQVKLSPDRATLDATGEDLSYVLVEACDKDGVLCPNAMNPVQFIVEGPATIAGVGNGNPQSYEEFVADHCSLFYGKAVLIIRTKHGETGVIKIDASSENLMPASIELNSE